MTQKDYAALAAALATTKPTSQWDVNRLVQWEHCVVAVARALAADNPRFNRDLFYAACGLEN